MKNLGKIVFVLLLSIPMYAGLHVSVDSNRVTQGDSVVLTISASGEKMEKLRLISVCDEDITSSASGTNITSINGSFSKENTYRYTFTPTKNCTIEPIHMNIDGKEEVSKPIAIKVSKMVVTKDAPFILEMKTDAKEVRVGEPFAVQVRFKMRHNAQALDSKYTPPEIKNIWVKKEEQGERFEAGDYTVTELTYIMAAQKTGLQNIGAAQMKIAARTRTRDAWGQWMPTMKWRSYYSNDLDINVTALPKSVTLVGDLKMDISVDAKTVQANEAVNVELAIEGVGNFEDIGSLKPYVANVSVFEEEPKINESIDYGNYKGEWRQKFTFVGDGDFEIPAFHLKYFNTKSQTIKTLTTQPIAISVKGGRVASQKEQVHVEKAQGSDNTQDEHVTVIASEDNLSVKSFGLGILVGLMITFLGFVIPWSKFKFRHDSVSLSDEKSLITLLMPYVDDASVKEMVNLLEARVYNGSDEKVDKKILKNMVKKYQN